MEWQCKVVIGLASDENQSNYGFLCPVGFILNQVERKRVAIKACLLSQNLEFLFVFRPTFLPLANTCHYQQSAVWYAESVLCVPGSGFLNTWKGKVLGSTLTFLSWATNKLSAIRPFRSINWYHIHCGPLSFVLWRIPPPSQIAALSPLWHSFNGNIAFFDGINGRLCQGV